MTRARLPACLKVRLSPRPQARSESAQAPKARQHGNDEGKRTNQIIPIV